MRLIFTAFASIQTADADGLKTFTFDAGTTADVPDDVATLFLASGVAEPAKAEKATKPAAEKAVKK